MSDVERARNATKTTANTASTTETTKQTTTTNSEQLQYKHSTSATTTATPGAAAAAAVKLQHQQLYHNQLYHQQQQQQIYSKPTTHYNYNSSTTVAQQQPQYQLITTAGGEFGNGADDSSIFGSCFGFLLKVLFSPPGLVALVVGYSMLGACIFPLLEAPQDINTSAAIAKSREECLRELWIITEKLNVLYERNWSTLVHEQLRRFEDSIVAATRHTNNSSYSIGMFGGSSTALRRYGSTFDASTDAMLAPTHWSFGEALLYSVTVITTIGHGSLTPRTAAGKIATILYALIGVPLMLMCLSSLGALLAEALQCTYARICCRLTRHQHHHTHHQHSHHHNHHHQHQQQQHKHEKCHSEKEKQPPPHDLYQQQTHHLQVTGEKSGHLLEASAGSMGVSGGASKYARRCSADSLDNDVLLKRGLSGCQQEKGQELDCKNCKYDALITERNLSSGYDYSNSGTMGDSGDDSCRLLHNSPAKLNQNQMLTGAKINAHYFQQQQQQPQLQQQHQQQRPDVMLMATTATAASKSIQQQYQQLYSRSATPSPQHFQHQQQQQQQPQQQQHTLQTFHIVSAGTSPTQQGQQQQQLPTLRQYATLQPHQHKPQQQQQQQYVAVPSGALVRFQTTTTTPATSGVASALNGNSNNCTTDGNGNVGIGVGATLIATGMSGNCYQSANVSVPGGTATATIYFPIATAAHPQQQQQQQSGYTSVASAATTTSNDATAMSGSGLGSGTSSAATTQLLCNQPIVKYHTIQLTHATRKQQQQQQQHQQPQQQTTLMGSAADVLPLPPPPAYQTATVHGIRRAKFLTKPLPPEISTLVAGERDLTCRHDLLLQQSGSSSGSNNATTTPTQSSIYAGTTTTATSNATTIAMLTAGLTATAAACSGNPPTTTATAAAATTANNTQMGTLMSGTSSMVGSNATVDIMEDEEEHEQQRLGNCPHGTPSRVPLISGSSGATNAHSTIGNTDEEQRGARSLFNATAASFHRHTLNTFQRNAAARKSTTYAATRRAGCNMHAASHRSGKSNSCYGDTATETSDDEDKEAAYMQREATAGEQFRLTKLNKGTKNTKPEEHSAYCDTDATADEAEDDETGSNADAEVEEAGAQVPISIVLLILICYICLGTVIFAFWENWSIVDGAYFCFVTLTTIGYGDFMPERTFHGPHVQLFACCAYLLLGLVLVAMSFSILETQLMWKCKRIAVRLKLAND
ncbi:AF4/FMR2 family member lilli [Zeugodacus cucurbitae]|uniref:AF4/FMR2 family member lilli n=1 Tax=Zeugodacus cucurbitae TaxID=28588 RepID=UPI0023D90157|nr:AF4/FMR2 family member lilli [Zeugodacus cucurbitae]